MSITARRLALRLIRMVITQIAHQDGFLSWRVPVCGWAVVYCVGVVEALADGVAFDDLETHGWVVGHGKGC